MAHPSDISKDQQSQSYSAYDATPAGYTQSSQVGYQQVQSPPAEPVARRVLKGIAVAAVIWLLIRPVSEWVGSDTRYDIPSRITLGECVSGGDDKSLSISEKILVDKALLLLARGSNVGGHADISTSSTLKGEAQFDISATFRGYRADELREYTKICVIKRDDGEAGIGLFTPSNRWTIYGANVKFNIRVQLPEKMTIPKFDSDLPNHSYKVGDIADLVSFDALLLKGSNGAIDAASLDFTEGAIAATNGKVHAGLLRTHKGVITTTNGPITGEFHSNKSLVLRATNGHIDTVIDMVDNDSSPLELGLSTTNSKIKSTINLSSTTSDSSNFKVVTTTTNGQLSVDIPKLPRNAKLSYVGRTTNDRASVTVAPAFEGQFEAATTNGNLMVDVNEKADDPTGKGRKRVVKTTLASRRAVVGVVYWGTEESGHDGHVLLSTTNANAELRL